MATDVAENRQGVLSIVELQAKEDVTPSDVVTTLWDYADSGAAIQGIAVVNAIERAQTTAADLRDIQEAAVAGIIMQARNRLHSKPSTVRAEQAEYAHVVGRVGMMLEDLAK